jgi:rubrerythrin
MTTRPRKARRVTVREVLDIAIDLEKKTMALYVAFVQAFPRPEEVRNFWFSMARHEAAHCGGLALVESIIESDPDRVKSTRVWFDAATVTRLRSLLTAYLRETRAGISVERAFEMAIDVESSELEDLVMDLLSVVRSPRWRERAVQFLLHDLGDLSYMVERYTKDDALLARADALIERHVGGLKKRRTSVAKRARATKGRVTHA